MLTLTVLGQTDNDDIKKTFKDYFHTVEQKDNAKTLDYIYPKLFDHFPKDNMLQAMDKMKADTTTIITTSNDSVTHISEILEIDAIKYALIKYSFKLSMTIKTAKDTTGIDGEEAINSADYTYEMLKEIYGDKHVKYDRENSKLDILATNELYAINDPIYQGWKFLEKKENMKPMLEKLLPKTVLRKL